MFPSPVIQRHPATTAIALFPWSRPKLELHPPSPRPLETGDLPGIRARKLTFTGLYSIYSQVILLFPEGFLGKKSRVCSRARPGAGGEGENAAKDAGKRVHKEKSQAASRGLSWVCSSFVPRYDWCFVLRLCLRHSEAPGMNQGLRGRRMDSYSVTRLLGSPCLSEGDRHACVHPHTLTAFSVVVGTQGDPVGGSVGGVGVVVGGASGEPHVTFDSQA